MVHNSGNPGGVAQESRASPWEGRWLESSPARAFILILADPIAMDERTDEHLVAEALAGDREAFASLVRRYQDYAYATAVGLLADLELSRDVAQEAFFRAFRDLKTLRDPPRFAGWLHGIVRFTAAAVLRERVRDRDLARKLGREPAAVAPAPDRAAERAEDHALVQEALRRLPDGAREMVFLYYVDGLSCRDIARYLDTTPTAVQGRLQRARTKLRRELAMIDSTLKDSAPDDAFAERVAAAIAVYTAKGPPRDSRGSDWETKLIAKTREILRAGDEGLRIDVELSKSDHPRIRATALLSFRLRSDKRAIPHVLRLMEDPVDHVRAAAISTYALLIRPDRSVGGFWPFGADQPSVPEGIERIFPLLDEPRWRMRWRG